jgi:2-polyprenyl-3-methyl-5-hydroxy-6-metoxy-1,4-benzoquinol methylase
VSVRQAAQQVDNAFLGEQLRERLMPLLSKYAQRKKLEYFLNKIPKDAFILEVGCAEGWVGRYAIKHGWKNFVGIDGVDGGYTYEYEFIHGDINQWKDLGLKGESFDAIIAFEVVEHGDFYDAIYSLLKPGGKLFVTTPVPHMDWACKILEALHLNQKRSSAHTHLIYLRDVPKFMLTRLQVKAGISQWGEFEKALSN